MADIVNGCEFSDLMLKQAKRQQQHFTTQPLSDVVEKELQQQALISLQQQKDLEVQDADTSISFDDFLLASQPRCVSDIEPLKAVATY